MKKIYLIILLFFSVSINSQNLIGAWERVQENDF